LEELLLIVMFAARLLNVFAATAGCLCFFYFLLLSQLACLSSQGPLVRRCTALGNEQTAGTIDSNAGQVWQPVTSHGLPAMHVAMLVTMCVLNACVYALVYSSIACRQRQTQHNS
jgi:hypothetical protein